MRMVIPESLLWIKNMICLSCLPILHLRRETAAMQNSFFQAQLCILHYLLSFTNFS